MLLSTSLQKKLNRRIRPANFSWFYFVTSGNYAPIFFKPYTPPKFLQVQKLRGLDNRVYEKQEGHSNYSMQLGDTYPNAQDMDESFSHLNLNSSYRCAESINDSMSMLSPSSSSSRTSASAASQSNHLEKLAIKEALIPSLNPNKTNENYFKQLSPSSKAELLKLNEDQTEFYLNNETDPETDQFFDDIYEMIRFLSKKVCIFSVKNNFVCEGDSSLDGITLLRSVTDILSKIQTNLNFEFKNNCQDGSLTSEELKNKTLYTPNLVKIVEFIFVLFNLVQESEMLNLDQKRGDHEIQQIHFKQNSFKIFFKKIVKLKPIVVQIASLLIHKLETTIDQGNLEARSKDRVSLKNLHLSKNTERVNKYENLFGVPYYNLNSESLIEKRKILKTIIDLDQKRHQNSSTFYQPTEDKSLARLDGNLQFMHDISYYRKKNKKSNKKSLGKSRDGSKYHRSTTDDSTMSSCSAIEVIDLEASNDVEFEFLE